MVLMGAIFFSSVLILALALGFSGVFLIIDQNVSAPFSLLFSRLTTESLVSCAIYLQQPLHPMYHMIPVLALTSPPVVLFLLCTN